MSVSHLLRCFVGLQAQVPSGESYVAFGLPGAEEPLSVRGGWMGGLGAAKRLFSRRFVSCALNLFSLVSWIVFDVRGVSLWLASCVLVSFGLYDWFVTKGAAHFDFFREPPSWSKCHS